jgi:uncharacterized protein (TIGR02217 family)
VSYPFIEQRFPGCPSWGFQFRPRFKNEIVANAGGDEFPFRHWTFPLHDCQVTVGPRRDDEIDELLDFFFATGGSYYGFRVKNYGDFKSCRPSQTPAGDDQPTVALGGDEFQMVKRYTVGAVTQDRHILKPVAGSVIVFDNGSPASSYTVDTTTGIIDFSVAPAGPVTWGGEFDLPMRFEGEFPIQIIDLRAHTVSFMLEELRNPA